MIVRCSSFFFFFLFAVCVHHDAQAMQKVKRIFWRDKQKKTRRSSREHTVSSWRTAQSVTISTDKMKTRRSSFQVVCSLIKTEEKAKKNSWRLARLIQKMSKKDLEKRVSKSNGWYIAHYAAYRGNKKILKILAQKKVNINLQSEVDGNTPLHIVHSKKTARYIMENLGFVNYNIKNDENEFAYQTLQRCAESKRGTVKARLAAAASYLKEFSEDAS